MERALAQAGFGVGARHRREGAGERLEDCGAAREQAGIAASAFDGIVREHQRRIYRVLVAIVRDEDTADTLTQECFLRAYRKRESFRGEARVGTWLVRIAVNLARDHIRSKKAGFWKKLFAGSGTRGEQGAGELSAEAERVADPGASVEEKYLRRERAAAVWTAAAALSPQQRAILVLRFAEELTMTEIGEAMELEVGTVKAHLHRAVSSLREKLNGNENVNASARKRT